MGYAEKLLAWFDTNKRDMPWRKTSNPYAIWVSEVMLQQTQVDTVIPYYNKFMNRFPTIHSLASATLEEVHTYWQGLGYYRRAENLHKGAQMVDEEYNGEFPSEVEKVKKIPGVGPYTMGAVLSIALNIPVPAVDGNVMRVLARQFLIGEDIGIAKHRKIFEQKVMELMPDAAGEFNQALMELGALVCSPQGPKCTECPVQDFCKAYKESCTQLYPVKLKKVKIAELHYKVLIIQKEDAVWMEKRPEEGLLANLWGFPLIDLKQWEEIKSMNLSFELGEQVIHIFTHRKWYMTPILINWDKQTEKLLKKYLKKSLEAQFVEIKQMENFPVATAFKKLIKILNIL